MMSPLHFSSAQRVRTDKRKVRLSLEYVIAYEMVTGHLPKIDGSSIPTNILISAVMKAQEIKRV